MRRRLVLTIAILTAGTHLGASTFAQDPSSQVALAVRDRVPLRSLGFFDGKITVRTKQGKDKEIRVVIRNWFMPKGGVVPRFPEEGFMIVQLQNGRLTTTIDGQREERKSGDFWFLPAGSTMSMETAHTAASLETMAMKSPP